ncbi:MAG: GNAT family N-acetyltransferase [Myxococcales bacterium]|nr:GNAT family N-acetyltransferase [Myxococcales bacterium]
MIRHPSQGELSSLFDLLNRCFRPQGEHMEHCFPHFLCDDNRQHLWVAVEEDAILSHVGYLPDNWEFPHLSLRVGRIGAVCTEESQRGKGWGTQLLCAAMDAARNEDIDLFVISGDRGLYERQGGVRCGHLERFQLGKAELAPFASSFVQTRAYQDSLLPAWIDMMQKESIRYGRSQGEWDILMGHDIVPWMREATHRPLAIYQGDDLVATLVLWERSAYTEVVEWAGDRSACLAALALYSASHGAVLPLRWSLPAHEFEVLAAFRAHGLHGQTKEADGVVCVLRWEALTTRLQALFQAHGFSEAAMVRLVEEGDAFSMVWSDAALRWHGRGTLARLLFGEPNVDAQSPLPSPVFEGPQAWGYWETLQKILPLPRPPYGMSYI